MTTEWGSLYFSIKKGTSLVLGTAHMVKIWADSANNSRRGDLAFHDIFEANTAHVPCEQKITFIDHQNTECVSRTINRWQPTQTKVIKKGPERYVIIDVQVYYKVSPVYCRNQYQFAPLPSGITEVDSTLNRRQLQIDTHTIATGRHTLTMKPYDRNSASIIEDEVTLNLQVTDFSQDCSQATISWSGNDNFKLPMMSTDQIFDLTVPNALGGYFLSSLSMCDVNYVNPMFLSGSQTGFSYMDGLRFKIAANSVFDGTFKFKGQIWDLNNPFAGMPNYLEQVVSLKSCGSDHTIILSTGQTTTLASTQTFDFQIDTALVKPQDNGCPAFTNYKLYDANNLANEQPAGRYEIQYSGTIATLKLKWDVVGSYDHVLGFEASGGTAVKLTTVPFKQINCGSGFETMTKTDSSHVLILNDPTLTLSLSSMFTVSSVDCGIVQFSLLKAYGSVFTSSQIYIDGSNNLKMTTQNSIIQTVCIKAETKGGVTIQAMVNLEVSCGAVQQVVYTSSATVLTIINDQTDDAVIKVTSSLDVALCQITSQTLSVEDQAGTVIQDYSNFIKFTPQINGVTQAEIKIIDKTTPRHYKFKITTSSGLVTLPQALVAEAIVEEAVVEEAVVEEAVVEEAVVEEAVVEEAVVEEAVVEVAVVEEVVVEVIEIEPPKFMFDPLTLKVEVGKAKESFLPGISYMGSEKVKIIIENQSELPGFISLTSKEGGHAIQIKETTIDSDVGTYTVIYLLSAQEKGSTELLKSTKVQIIKITKAEKPIVDSVAGKMDETTTEGGAQEEENSEEDGKQIDENGEGTGNDDSIDTGDSVNQSTSSTVEDAEEAEATVINEEEEAKKEETKQKDLLGSAKATVQAKVNPNVNKLSEEDAKKLFLKYFPKKSESIENKDESIEIQDKKKLKPVKMKINEITRNGDVVINFNQKLVVPPFIDRKSTENQGDPQTDKKRELIPLSAINVERDILEFFFILNSDEEQKGIEFFIEMKEWTEIQMTLNLNFTDPMQISRGAIPDVAVIKIKNKQLFKSQESDKTIESGEVFVRKTFPKQLPSGINEKELQNQAEQASTGVKVLFFVQLGLQISLKGSLDELFTLFFTLQIICYLKIYDVPMPSNTEIYINELTKLIEFEVLNLDSIVKNTIDPEFSLTDFILGQSESSYGKDGLERQSLYQEIKFFLLLAIMVVVFCLVLLIARFFKIFKTKVSEYIKKSRKKFFFNGMIRSITIIYIQICITFGAQLGLYLKNTKTQSREDQVLGLTCFVFLGLFPFWCWLIIISNKENLEHPEVEEKIGNLYNGVRVKHGKNEHLFYFPMFLIRRIIFVAVPTFLYAYSYFQVQLLLFLTSLYIIFYTGNHPHIDKRRTAIENFNEVMIMIINYHMVCFSEFNLDVQQQFNMGYSLVVVIFFIIGINLISMMCVQVEKVKRHGMLKKNKSAETQMAIKKREFYALLGTLAKSNMDLQQLKNTRSTLIKNKHDFVTHIAELQHLAYDSDQISRIKYPEGSNELINIAPPIIENQQVAESFREINDMINITFGGLQGLAEYNRNSILFQVDRPPTLVDLNDLEASAQQAEKRRKSIRSKRTKKSKTLQLVPPMPEILEMDEQNTIEMIEVPTVDFPVSLAKPKTVQNKNNAILPKSLTQNEEEVNIASLLKSSEKTEGRRHSKTRKVLNKKKTMAFIGLTEEDLSPIAKRVNNIGIINSDMKD